MLRRIVAYALMPVVAVMPATAGDQSSIGYVHLGVGYVRQADDASLSMLGIPVPGAGFETEAGVTLALETSVFLIDGFALAVSGTVPTTTSNMATGTIAAFGNLGDETVGFYSATAQYHFAINDVITPYLGAGVGYMHVFDTVDGAVTDMSVASALGGVAQAGVDIALTDSIGVFLDVKRYFISTTASGTIGGAAITARANVDPWVLSSGLSVRF